MSLLEPENQNFDSLVVTQRYKEISSFVAVHKPQDSRAQIDDVLFRKHQLAISFSDFRPDPNLKLQKLVAPIPTKEQKRQEKLIQLSLQSKKLTNDGDMRSFSDEFRKKIATMARPKAQAHKVVSSCERMFENFKIQFKHDNQNLSKQELLEFNPERLRQDLEAKTSKHNEQIYQYNRDIFIQAKLADLEIQFQSIQHDKLMEILELKPFGLENVAIDNVKNMLFLYFVLTKLQIPDKITLVLLKRINYQEIYKLQLLLEPGLLEFFDAENFSQMKYNAYSQQYQDQLEFCKQLLPSLEFDDLRSILDCQMLLQQHFKLFNQHLLDNKVAESALLDKLIQQFCVDIVVCPYIEQKLYQQFVLFASLMDNAHQSNLYSKEDFEKFSFSTMKSILEIFSKYNIVEIFECATFSDFQLLVANDQEVQIFITEAIQNSTSVYELQKFIVKECEQQDLQIQELNLKLIESIKIQHIYELLEIESNNKFIVDVKYERVRLYISIIVFLYEEPLTFVTSEVLQKATNSIQYLDVLSKSFTLSDLNIQNYMQLLENMQTDLELQQFAICFLDVDSVSPGSLIHLLQKFDENHRCLDVFEQSCSHLNDIQVTALHSMFGLQVHGFMNFQFQMKTVLIINLFDLLLNLELKEYLHYSQLQSCKIELLEGFFVLLDAESVNSFLLTSNFVDFQKLFGQNEFLQQICNMQEICTPADWLNADLFYRQEMKLFSDSINQLQSQIIIHEHFLVNVIDIEPYVQNQSPISVNRLLTISLNLEQPTPLTSNQVKIADIKSVIQLISNFQENPVILEILKISKYSQISYVVQSNVIMQQYFSQIIKNFDTQKSLKDFKAVCDCNQQLIQEQVFLQQFCCHSFCSDDSLTQIYQFGVKQYVKGVFQFDSNLNSFFSAILNLQDNQFMCYETLSQSLELFISVGKQLDKFFKNQLIFTIEKCTSLDSLNKSHSPALKQYMQAHDIIVTQLSFVDCLNINEMLVRDQKRIQMFFKRYVSTKLNIVAKTLDTVFDISNSYMNLDNIIGTIISFVSKNTQQSILSSGEFEILQKENNFDTIIDTILDLSQQPILLNLMQIKKFSAFKSMPQKLSNYLCRLHIDPSITSPLQFALVNSSLVLESQQFINQIIIMQSLLPKWEHYQATFLFMNMHNYVSNCQIDSVVLTIISSLLLLTESSYVTCSELKQTQSRYVEFIQQLMQFFENNLVQQLFKVNTLNQLRDLIVDPIYSQFTDKLMNTSDLSIFKLLDLNQMLHYNQTKISDYIATLDQQVVQQISSFLESYFAVHPQFINVTKQCSILFSFTFELPDSQLYLHYTEIDKKLVEIISQQLLSISSRPIIFEIFKCSLFKTLQNCDKQIEKQYLMQVTCLDTLDLNIHDLWKINEMFIAEQEAFNTKIEVLIELVRELELSDLIRKNTDFLCLNALAVNIYDEVLNKVLCFALEIQQPCYICSDQLNDNIPTFIQQFGHQDLEFFKQFGAKNIQLLLKNLEENIQLNEFVLGVSNVESVQIENIFQVQAQVESAIMQIQEIDAQIKEFITDEIKDVLNSICPIPYFVNITDEFANMFLSLLLKIKSPSYLLPNQVSLAKVQLFAEELSNGLLIFKLFESANLVEVNSKFAANMEVQHYFSQLTGFHLLNVENVFECNSKLVQEVMKLRDFEESLKKMITNQVRQNCELLELDQLCLNVHDDIVDMLVSMYLRLTSESAVIMANVDYFDILKLITEMKEELIVFKIYGVSSISELNLLLRSQPSLQTYYYEVTGKPISRTIEPLDIVENNYKFKAENQRVNTTLKQLNTESLPEIVKEDWPANIINVNTMLSKFLSVQLTISEPTIITQEVLLKNMRLLNDRLGRSIVKAPIISIFGDDEEGQEEENFERDESDTDDI